jgi:beta-phosphoglucomutase-like phosphatase (HAD superfamily)
MRKHSLHPHQQGRLRQDTCRIGIARQTQSGFGSTEDLEQLKRLESRAAAPQRRLNILLRAQALRRKMRRRRKKLLPGSAELLDQLRGQRDCGI